METYDRLLSIVYLNGYRQAMLNSIKKLGPILSMSMPRTVEECLVHVNSTFINEAEKAFDDAQNLRYRLRSDIKLITGDNDGR